MVIRRTILTVVAVAMIASTATAAQAQAAAPPSKDTGPPIFPVGSLAYRPPGFKVDGSQALAIAETSPKLLAIHRAHHPLQYLVCVWLSSHYEIYFYFHGHMVADVLVLPSGRLGPTYTGPLILGIYARGGYGQDFDSPWVWVPFGLMFLLPLAFLRRRRWTDLLDLTAVLAFGVSYVLFDNGHLEPAVWLFYPPLLYLLVRMLIRGARPPTGDRRFDCRLPTAVLVGGLLLLAAGRIFMTLLRPEVIDVGGASAIGAYHILHGQSIYFQSLGHPDTYGPIAYLAYVPFQLIWPGAAWSTFLTSVRATTITLDLLTIGALVLLGMRLRRGREGRRLGLVLAWLWAACPFTVFMVYDNTNDGLVALLVVLTMLSLAAPIRRGVLLGLAAAAKFFPAILLPLMAASRRGGDERAARRVLAGFVIAAGASIALFLPPGGLIEMYDHTIGYQLTRPDIFSIWALHPSLAPVKVVVELGVVALALVVAFRPRGRRTVSQVSALAAALIIAVQLPAMHWFYFYIAWFLPLVLIAVLGADAPAPPDAIFQLEAVPLGEASDDPGIAVAGSS